MGIKTYNPYTPSRRHMTGLDFTEVTKSTPEKSLTTSLKKTAGRNNQGKITVRHRGGGVRRKYRIIDFKRRKDGIPATVTAIEYDPNRTANIALLTYADGEKAYIIAPNKLAVGATVMNGPDAEIKVGNCLHGKHSGRYRNPQYRNVSWKRRTVSSFRGKFRSAYGERRKVCNPSSSVR